MSFGCDFFGFETVAAAAVSTLLALCSTGGIGGSCPVAHIVSQCINSFLCNQNFFADRAVLALRQTAFGAGSRNRFIDYFGMAICRDFFGFKMVAAAAVSALLALCSTGGIGGSCPVTHVMSQSSNFIGNVAVATGTGVAGIAAIFTSRRSYDNFIVVFVIAAIGFPCDRAAIVLHHVRSPRGIIGGIIDCRNRVHKCIGRNGGRISLHFNL